MFPIINISTSRRCMNVLVALMMLTASRAEPHVYYYNGKNLVELRTIEMPNVRHVLLRFFVHSPYEMRDARVDSSDAEMCLPGISLRKKLKLEGRWYVVTWHTRLSTGSTRHTIVLYSCLHKAYNKTFWINVEGSKRIEKLRGVN